ncbi:unnamed protein product [Parnassius apollo]|uniref:(apollo) hypothetical protein n=1 Tax=Parnassius apollo TaxID=110799 RepID=A0A8S3WG23_PARAO|nr:unnamed protein product [Parnassius apollo]
MTVVLLQWLTFELSPHICVCGACYDTIRRLATNSRKIQLEFSSLASVVSSCHHHVIAANILCHGCYVKAKREVIRRNIVDYNRFTNIEGN